ncbi:MAG: ABC transporter ATP-binding protein [Clostridiales bacterium]|nr:ABC transporter ATP-binding protein [Clostridiales bacterium]
MGKSLLSLTGINKYYDKNHILKDVSFEVIDGEFLTFLGPSGCGKTTLLRCIAGLEEIDSGDILLKGQSIKGLSPNKRNVNTVFQNYSLFPHLNVYDNIAYGPRVKKSMAGDELKTKITDMLELVQMSGYEERMPNQLSGGEKQRIAIARALINEPDILLLDEPLGALDLKLRKHMQRELAHLQEKTGTTFIYVTHDQDEALNMSHRIAVIEKGRIQQLGSPREIYNNPRNLFVASFIGDRNIRKVKILEGGEGFAKVELGSNIIDIRCVHEAQHPCKSGDTAILAIHTDKMQVSCHEMPNSIKGIVTSIHFAGSQTRIDVDVDGEDMIVIEYLKNECECKVGDPVYLVWEETGAVLLPLEDSEDPRGFEEGDAV